MIKKFSWPRISWRNLRFRLIGWYVLLLVLTLALFSVYIFFQFRNLEQTQQDTRLEGAANNVRGLIDFNFSTTPRFRNFPGSQGAAQDLNRENIQVRLIAPDGTVSDSLGTFVSEMPVISPIITGYTTATATNNAQWRIFSQRLPSPPGQLVLVQVGQPLLLLDTQINGLFTPILLGTLIAMVLAVFGGLFLANQALSPIDRVTRTAQAISTRDLTKRINYHGPNDEIGRLAKTLDQMLDRLDKGFEQERRFTSDASHELRTPLTALKGRIEVTLNRLRSPEEYKDTLAGLGVEVDRLVRLSNSLLYLARLDQAQSNKVWQFEKLNLSDLLDSVVESMQPVAELKQLELSGQILPDISIQGNLDQLTRLFLNLLDNAIKYTPEGGRVSVNLIKDNNNANITFSDNGRGIALEHLSHLFERFYRADSDRASNSGGAGLGLAIAYEIARQHGGTLEAESQLGQGTSFKVSLPLPDSPKK